jgi:CRISPR-associated endonuclease/helicase Cas3
MEEHSEQNSGAPAQLYAAHTPNDSGRWQLMREHLLAVAQMAGSFARGFGAAELAYWAGLFHDLGKYSPEFQQYLRACHRAEQGLGPKPQAGSAPHKATGAALGARMVTQLLAPVILGHHGEMPGRAETKLETERLSPSVVDALFQTAKQDCPDLDPPADLKALVRQLGSNPAAFEMLARMIFSCLVDADALDTEQHFKPTVAQKRRRPLPVIEDLRDALLRNQVELQATVARTKLNGIRRDVYDACRAAASQRPGVYKLTVPTGGGKTRSSLAFALEHASQHGLERVIYAIPYTSIVDQTAQEFERICGTGVVLEHHSALEPDEGRPEWELWRRLASQNWDAPLVVTTTVQLFESLFGNRPGRCRKVHHLARSVIVLDEVQTLPVKLLKPIVDGLRCLCEQYGTTILLCTATQPALDQQSLEKIGFPEAREVAPNPERLFAELRRVEYDLTPLAGEGWEWERVADEMRQTGACLTIVNTRRDAIALLEALDDDKALHLSTLLCGRHRRDALAEVRRRLKADEPCHVVSTQVVEAGVDLDFPRVLRAIGPLDRIVQAAGRCNREGGPILGRVTVFRPIDGGTPQGSYRVALDVASRFLREGADLHDPAVYEQYFRDLYRQDTLDAHGVQKLRGELDFPRVAEKMRLIEDDTVGVLVRYAPAEQEVEDLIAAAEASRHGMTSELWRKVQPFLVSVYRREFDDFRRRGMVTEIVPDLWLWLGGYHSARGLTAASMEPSELIV